MFVCWRFVHSKNFAHITHEGYERVAVSFFNDEISGFDSFSVINITNDTVTFLRHFMYHDVLNNCFGVSLRHKKKSLFMGRSKKILFMKDARKKNSL